jgi:hypothetical protein
VTFPRRLLAIHRKNTVRHRENTVRQRQNTALLMVFCGLAAGASASPQSAADEDYHVYTDSPRLLLTKQRLRLLQRERDRQSMRWQQFDSLISGGVPMPEPGIARALYYQVTKDPAAGKQAVEWALGADSQKDLRQLAIVFDWCGPVMTKAQGDKVAEKIERGLGIGAGSTGSVPPADTSVNPGGDIVLHNARALAAIAIADRLPDHGNAILGGLIQQWWRGVVAKRIAKGQPAAPREQYYAMFEMMHAIRDNLKVELREAAPLYFRTLPIDDLAGHYPPALPTPENEYRVPVYVREGDPNVTDATMARAAELAMVAYDDNARESQYVQGWLMQDRFVMQSGLGCVYEFLWANPYQPGLSYFQVPLVFHDTTTGHVFARTSWDEDAAWLGYFEGHLQIYKDGKIQSLRAGAAVQPVRIGDALLLSAESKDADRFQANAEAVFVLNLTPRTVYQVEVDDQELEEVETDAGGTLVLSFPEGAEAGVRIRRRGGEK